MPARVTVSVVLACLLGVSCDPSQKCGGELYFDGANNSCRPCPKNSRFAYGTCVCADDYAFVDHRCVAPADASQAIDDADSGVVAEPLGCLRYCDFVKTCFADNMLAQSALSTVVTGLYADMHDTCVRRCSAVSAGNEQPLARCIDEGRKAAACDASGQEGLKGAITLLGQCSKANAGDPLRTLICEGLTSSPLVATQLDFCD